MNAYRKLREFRRLHETQWPLDTMRDPEHPRNLLPKKKRGKVLMNQKANSIADLAAVLLQQEAGVSTKRRERAERVLQRVNKIVRQKGLSGEEHVRQRRKERLEKVDVVKEYGGVVGVRVHWADIRDAEFAEQWPKELVHADLRKSRYTAAWPVGEKEEQTSGDGEKVPKDAEVKEAPSEEAVKMGLATPPKKTWRETLFGPKSPPLVAAP